MCTCSIKSVKMFQTCLTFHILLQVMVIDYKLAFPGGTATALMINSLHGKTETDVSG